MELQPFPATQRSAKRLRGIQTVEVYCHCRLPEGNAKMIQCIACREWFHQHCETVPQTVWKDIIQSGSVIHVMHNFVKLQALYVTFVKSFSAEQSY